MCRITLVSLLLLPPLVFAHGDGGHGEAASATLEVGGAVALSHYSAGVTDPDGLWRIPGLLMGGEAFPVEKGTRLDAASLWGRYALGGQANLHAAVGAHTHGSETSLALESLYFDYQWQREQPVYMALGLMDAAFSPQASTHTSSREFAENALLADAFWGGSIHDKAVRLEWQAAADVKAGMEIREGDFFPASRDGSAKDVYVEMGRTWAGWQAKGGVWGMRTEAHNRADTRYQAGHSHGTSSTVPADVRFTGKSKLLGAWLDLAAPAGHGLEPSLQYEWVNAQEDGKLFDTTHLANYVADHLGYALTPAVRYGKAHLSYRFERLSLENRLAGAGAQVLAEDANLLTRDHPTKQTLQLGLDAGKSLTLRAAYTFDQTLAEDDQRFSVGMVWQGALYRK